MAKNLQLETLIQRAVGSSVPQNTMVANSEYELEKIWELYELHEEMPDDIDYSKHTVAAVCTGMRPGPAYVVEVTEAVHDDKEVRLYFEESTPSGMGGATMVTSSAHIVKVERATTPNYIFHKKNLFWQGGFEDR